MPHHEQITVSVDPTQCYTMLHHEQMNVSVDYTEWCVMSDPHWDLSSHNPQETLYVLFRLPPHDTKLLPPLSQRWANVADVGPSLDQRWATTPRQRLAYSIRHSISLHQIAASLPEGSQDGLPSHKLS